MARFRVYRLKGDDVLAIDLQSDFLDDLPSRVMAPLHNIEGMSWAISRLNPRVTVNGRTYVMATQRMASIPLTEIGAEVADLSSRSDDITAALDFLFQGF
ncbi:CcdB family protein [Rhizobium sp. S163]|uniref:CcdB family protein n=1 Tax=Rhizobium sp. S163 TaxID=3055039 RepID=UPI0025AA21F6|nr:CcdB family protein [Rhizobium sp. S163]MDM9646847.1 CcdB family protein [Rhizobium sp. S163]